jgi:hypothetical protein
MATADELAAKYGVAPAAPAPKPDFLDRLGEGVAGLGRTVASGATALGGLAADEIRSLPGSFMDTLSAVRQRGPGALLDARTDALSANPAARRELERGADSMLTLGYGQRLADRIGGGELAATAAADRAAAPDIREGGMLLGAFSPGATSAIAKGGGQLVKAATGGLKAASLPAAVGLGAVRGIGGYEATAPLTTALSADAEGRRLDAAREAATDPAGLLLSGVAGGGGGALSRASETAPERVLARAKRDITTGEQNAGKRKTEKLSTAAGPDDEKLRDLFGRDPDLYKEIATKGKASPGKAVEAVADKKDEISGRLDVVYDQMQKADRLVTPSDIAVEFDKLLADKLKGGDLPAVNILRAERARFLNEYGNFGKLGADTMRGLKSSAGKGAFEGMPIPGAIKRDIWGVYSSAIERQAKGTPGVDLTELRQLNKDMSVLIPAEDALQERATAAAADRKSIGSHIGHAALAGAGFAHGGLKEAAVGLALPTAAKLAGQGLRRADFALAQRTGGAAADFGSTAGARTAQLEYATKVAEGMRNGLSLADAVEAAGHDAPR